MRWEALFSDLAGQFDAAARAGLEDELIDLTEAEMATSGIADRLRARLGRALSVRLVGGSLVQGEVLDAAPQWLLLADGGRRALVPLHSVVAAWPLGEVAPAASVAERRLRLTHVLRAVAREGTAVLVRTEHGDYRGWLVRVAADHIDLRVDDAGGVLPVRGDAVRSPGRDAAVVSVVLGHVVAVQTL
ncbi:hypothetical protein [Georgenia sp. MJ170]|uniref:hypothetical protein n=1 Tax=Georgenia sunbinii TaxID=3117728 RepID=UPI002F26CB2C